MRFSASSALRFAVPVVLLLVTAGFLRAHSEPERPIKRRPVADIPRELAGWRSLDNPISNEMRENLGPGEFLSRIYTRPKSSYVDFFIAYFPSQRTGNTIHSPKNCLPGSGWSPTESGQIQIQRPDGKKVGVNRYIIARGADRQFVLYWYQAHSRVVASEYHAKFFLVKDALAMNRTDGSLVRVITPIGSGESTEAAQQRAVGFAELALGNLDEVIPR